MLNYGTVGSLWVFNVANWRITIFNGEIINKLEDPALEDTNEGSANK